MPPPDIDHRAFLQTRARLAEGEQGLVEVQSELTVLGRQRADLQARGASGDTIAAAGRAFRDAQRRRDEMSTGVRRARERLDDLAEDLVTSVEDPASLVELLDGQFPIALLPVRLETRFTADGRALRVRIFPDQFHLYGHDPELTEAEVTAGTAYWHAVWSATAEADEPIRAQAWQAITTDVAATRARWVVDAMTPTNIHDRETAAGPSLPTPVTTLDSWVRPVRATALPDRWLGIGRRGRATVLRGWSNRVPDTLPTTPTPGAEDGPEPEGDGVPLDPELAWLTDYAEAEKIGMAMTLTSGTGRRRRPLTAGLDSLLVVGVDWTLQPREAAQRLADLVDGHRYFDGLAVVPPGTATNQTSSTQPSQVAPTGRDATSLRPDTTVTSPAPGSASQRLQTAMGVLAAGLDAAPGADSTAADTALLLQDVVWPATLGYYLDDLLEPVVTDDMIAFARDFVTTHLVPGGPLPTLRVGAQPYGILPCVAPGDYRPSARAPFERRLFDLLQAMRPAFGTRIGSLPRMGTSDDPGDDLLPLLQRGPLAQSARFRHVHGGGYWHNVTVPTDGATDYLHATVAHSIWATMLALRPTFLARLAPDAESYRLPVPWAQAGVLTPHGRLDPDYLTDIADLLQGADARSQLLARHNATTLLEALTAASATEELDRRLAELAARFRIDRADTDDSDQRVTLATDELVGVLPDAVDLPDSAIRIQTHEQLAEVKLTGLTDGLTLADHVTTRLHVADPQPPVRAFADYVARLRELAARPVPELDQAFRGFLDATSHRLDAWYTALATQRLAEVREQHPAGIHIGAWGYVEDLRPDPRPDSLGYVHAPSLAHATTAALLRSGHLTHRDPDDRDRFDMQLSSSRVGPAMAVLDGVAHGQQLAALLGYRLERAIHEDDLTLAQFILPLRRLAPLDGRDPDTVSIDAAETIAARDVVDGVRLLERWRVEGVAIFGQLDPAPNAGARTALAVHLDLLETVFDAVGDVLVAETIHQSAMGNYERAGAALAALDRQEVPPAPDVLATPRTGARCTQRLAVLLPDSPPRTAWQAPVDDLRSTTSPRVDAWVASLLPDPSAIRFAGLLRGQDGTTTHLSADAGDLGLSALSLAAAARSGSGDLPSELDQRVVTALVGGIDLASVAGEEAALEVLDAPPAGSGSDTIGLAALRAQLHWISQLLARSRPLRITDLALPEEAASDTVDLDDVTARADAVAARLAAVADQVAAVSSDDSATIPDLERALLMAATVAVDGAVPPVGMGPAEGRRPVLVQQAARVDDDLRRRRQSLADLEAEHAAVDPPPEHDERVAQQVGRIRMVLGEAFPFIGRVAFPTGDPGRDALDATLAEASELTDGDDLAARSWVDRLATVRPGVRGLADVLVAAELFTAPGGDPKQFTIAQLPHVPGQRWFALPYGDTPPAAEPDVALVLHHPGTTAVSVDGSLSGLVVDEWVETVPSVEEMTGLTFHYDAPAARAPQAILLAVPGEADQDHWTLDGVIATIREAIDLAKLRGLTPDELPATGTFLPMTYLPHRFTRDQVPPPLSALLDAWSDNMVAKDVVGKQYLTPDPT